MFLGRAFIVLIIVSLLTVTGLKAMQVYGSYGDKKVKTTNVKSVKQPRSNNVSRKLSTVTPTPELTLTPTLIPPTPIPITSLSRTISETNSSNTQTSVSTPTTTVQVAELQNITVTPTKQPVESSRFTASPTPEIVKVETHTIICGKEGKIPQLDVCLE